MTHIDHHIAGRRVSGMNATHLLAWVATIQQEITSLEPHKTSRKACEVVRHIHRQTQLCTEIVDYLNNRAKAYSATQGPQS